MRNKFILFLMLGILGLGTLNISAQEKLQTAVGVAKVVGEQKIVLETKGGTLDAVLTKTTTYFRLPPDNLKLSAATDSKLAEISVSDRVLVTGNFSDDKKTLYAVKVYLVKGSDIAGIQQKQRQDWQTRGISGRVAEVDSVAKTITVEMRGLTGAATTIKVTPKDNASYKRYAASSVKYNDALESKFADIQKDDMIQVRGDKSEDGTILQAEEILSGAFQTVAGTIKSVDAEKNEIVITDFKTKKDITIAVKETSLVRRFPEETAQRMARFQAMAQTGGGVQPPRGGGAEGSNRGNGEGRGNRGNGEGRGNRGNGDGQGNRGGGGRMDINEMINNFPPITIADLKAGEVIAVSSAKTSDENRLTAIKLLAGVEPFLQMSAAANSGNKGRGRGGVSGSLNIPGLDGVDF